MKTQYQSWGRYFKFEQQAKRLDWMPNRLEFLTKIPTTVLPYGHGRSYGDSCLNEGGTLLDTRPLDHFLAFDQESGVLRCEAGVTFAQILAFSLPRGWFLPVTPGTKFVSVGGAIANDVHGKNHHSAGTFGCHVSRLGLLRSDGVLYECSPQEHADLFNATIGGLGLTGLILWAEFQLIPVQNPYFAVETIPFRSLAEFFKIAEESDKDFVYTVSWVDTTATGKNIGRGVFFRGNHAEGENFKAKKPRRTIPVPFEAPSGLLNRFTMKLFNEAVYAAQKAKPRHSVVHYEPFFYPLDSLVGWNKLYGPRGFFQYQLVVPPAALDAIQKVLAKLAEKGEASFLTVLKTFGDRKSPGMMSFPMPGITLNLDFPNKGDSTIKLVAELDRMVMDVGGRVYPAKDSLMQPEAFKAYYPQWAEFAKWIDPKFSSSFWRRVTNE